MKNGYLATREMISSRNLISIYEYIHTFIISIYLCLFKQIHSRYW